MKKYYTEEDMLKEYGSIDKVNWFYISHSMVLSEQLINKYQDKVKWNYIWAHQPLSNNFIIKYFIRINYFALQHNTRINKFIRNIIKNVCDRKLTPRQAYKLLKSDYAEIMDKL